MSFNIKIFLSSAKTVTSLSINHHENLILPVLSLWLAVTYVVFPHIPLISFLVDQWKKQAFVFISPLIILIMWVGLYYWLSFKKIIVVDQKYFFSFPVEDEDDPTMISQDFIESPAFILNENFTARFSFKLRLYGNIYSKFKNKRFVLIIKKAPTIDISLKQRNKNLEQKYYNPNKELFVIEQEYELFSSQLSFSVHIGSRDATDTNKLEIYVECEDFIKKLKEDPNLQPKNLIHSEEFYLSK